MISPVHGALQPEMIEYSPVKGSLQPEMTEYSPLPEVFRTEMNTREYLECVALK